MTSISEVCMCGGEFSIETRYDANAQELYRRWRDKHQNCKQQEDRPHMCEMVIGSTPISEGPPF